jgi:MSHA biogenesis protein MshQ
LTWTPSPPQGFNSEQELTVIGRPPSPRYGAPQEGAGSVSGDEMAFENMDTMGYEFDWFDFSWNKRIPLTVETGQVPSTQTDFPLLINLTSTDLVGAAEAELRFAGTDRTQLEYEIQSFDTLTGKLIAWINKPTIDDSDRIFIYYDNIGALDEQDSGAVWNKHNELGVWHLDNDLLDSTPNGENGTARTSNMPTTPVFAPSQIGDGFNSAGTKYVRVAAFPNLGNSTASEEFSISYWFAGLDAISAVRFQPSVTPDFLVYPITVSSDRHILSWDGGDTPSGLAHGIVQDGITQNLITVNWKRDTVNGYQAYRNGVLIEERNSADVTIPNLVSSIGIQFGALREGTANMDGIIGHITVQDEIKSPDTITAESNNQNDPGAFFSVGTEETVPEVDTMGYEA